MAKLPGYHLRLYLLMLFSLCVCQKVNAQANYHLIFSFPHGDSTSVMQRLKLRTSFSTRLQISDYVLRLPSILQAGGYITASVDSDTTLGNTTFVSLYAGQYYGAAGIRIKEADKPDVKSVGGRTFNEKKALTFSQYRVLQNTLLDHFENTGYPFAQVMLDSVAIQDQQIKAVIAINRGIPYKFDSIRLFGNARISRNFIHRYLGIERGSVYRKDKLEKMNQRLLELPYLQQQQPWDVTMLSTGSIVNLYLQPKKSNQVNVLAGFLPANTQTGGKLLFTIDANLLLKNAFGTGENVGIVWQQIQPQSPRLNLQFQQPYIFNSPFGVDFLFDLYKRDSIYLNINAQVGLLYAFSAGNTGKLFIQNQRTNLLQVDTNRIRQFKSLPDIIDVSSVNIGIDYETIRTDYRFNPRRGSELKFFAGAGSKKIRPNNTIVQIKDPLFNYAKLYDTIALNTYQVRVKFQGAYYFPVGKQAVLKSALNAGWYQSPNYFTNELFQIGGYRLLRGFDEESIFVSRYAVATLEYRYLIGLNSYFFGFTDVGSGKDGSNESSGAKSYIGAGLGIAFETKGGIFNVSFAAGKRNDLEFNIRQSKIHIGYVSVF